LVAGPRPQEIAIAEAELQQAEARLELAQITLNRVEPAVQQGAARAEELDQANNELKAARATLAMRQQNLSLLREGTRKEEIAAAQAQVREDEASAAALRRQIGELAITAPVSGTVEAIELRPGDLIGANAPALSIMDRDNLWIRAYVPENRLNLSIGQPLQVTVDSFPGRRFNARVSFVARQAEFTPGNVQTPEERSKQVFRIKATFEDGDEVLRPGMSGDVWLDPPAAPATAPAEARS
jgi:multidrug resistance efflux pump